MPKEQMQLAPPQDDKLIIEIVNMDKGVLVLYYI